MVMPKQPGSDGDCHRINGILNIVGDKWTVLVVVVLRERPQRFNELKRSVGGISQQMLTRTLKALERDGFVRRTVRHTVPPQVEYELKPLGLSLSEPVLQLGVWAHAHIAEIERNRSEFDEASAVDRPASEIFGRRRAG